LAAFLFSGTYKNFEMGAKDPNLLNSVPLLPHFESPERRPAQNYFSKDTGTATMFASADGAMCTFRPSQSLMMVDFSAGRCRARRTAS
jgi:hypothetical protein